jgi:hypothetical protein
MGRSISPGLSVSDDAARRIPDVHPKIAGRLRESELKEALILLELFGRKALRSSPEMKICEINGQAGERRPFNIMEQSKPLGKLVRPTYGIMTSTSWPSQAEGIFQGESDVGLVLDMPHVHP